MPNQVYNWKRFWRPISSPVNLTGSIFRSSNLELEGEYAYNLDLVAFDAISDIPCLILLGEANIGKTTELKQAYEQVRIQVSQSEDDCLWVNLGDYESDRDLCDAIFGNETFQNWLKGCHNLHLFLDSLDEGLLSIRILVRILNREIDKIKKLPCNCLYFRIACSASDWQDSLKSKLKEKWGESNVGVCELTPLQKADIIEAAKDNKINPSDFFQEVFNQNAISLTIKPFTLQYLLSKYIRNEALPSSRKELYEQAFWELCEEVNPDRCASGYKGRLSSRQRLIVAGRIAALTIFCECTAVWLKTEYRDKPNSDLGIRDLCVGKETVDGQEFPVNEDCVREVFSITKLFSLQENTNRLRFTTQADAEFLAAWYLNLCELSITQIMQLITPPDNTIVPQLKETVAWLASMIPEVFQKIAETNPDVLLQSDIATVTDIDKSTLVESLLRAYDEEGLPYSYRFWQYQHLSYPKLPDKLREYIANSSKHESSRLTAIDIARACDIKAIQSDLVAVALESSQPYWIRINATNTLGQIGDEENKARLKPLVVGLHDDDPEDYLKGYALQAIFPQHLPVEELLENITQPKSQSIGGAYLDFIARDLAERLQIQDIPVILRWLTEKLPRRYGLSYPFQELSDSVLLKAWQNCDEPDVLEAFANVAMCRLKQHEGILGALSSRSYTLDNCDDNHDDDIEPFLKDSDEKRRQLIETIVSLTSESENDCSWLIRIIASEDILWMIKNATSAESDRVINIWVKLSSLALNWHNLCWKEAKYADAILEACDVSSAIRSEFEFDITPLKLGSDRAKQVESTYRQYQIRPRKPESLLDPPPKQRVLAILEKVEAEHAELWWQVCLEMTLKPTNTHYNGHSALKLDLTTLPGWLAADIDTKARIIKIAKEYLEVGDPEAQTWLGTNNFSNPPFAGYQALYLLSKQEPDYIATISTNTWIKWIPVILHFANSPSGNKGEKDEDCQRIIRTAYQNASGEFIETLIVLMNSNNYRPRSFYSHDVYRLVSHLLDDPLPEAIINKIGIDNLQAGMLEILLADFFNKQPGKAKSLAVCLVFPSVLGSEEGRARAVVAARLLALHPDDFSWLAVWSTIQQDHEFGREVLESVALQAARQGQIEQQIKEEYVAELYIFLAQEYPDVEDCKRETRELRGIEAQIVSESDEIRMWKSYIPQRLQERGTWQACEALRKIIRELPELKDKLQWRLLEAETLTRRQNWQPLKPEEFLRFILDQNKRLVQNGDQLLEALIESLSCLEIELQGETSAIRDVWDKDKGKNNLFRPIDENDFSNYVKRFLDRDLKSRGIIVNREVELRRSYGGNPGERTDIHVDAVLKHPNGEVYDSITVIIEVKGCWHEELDHAMESQLVQRYLSDSTCHYGLYLVAWFNCNQWDQGDNRRKDAPKLSLDEARAKFTAQADQLSQSGLRVKSFVLNTALR